MGDIVIRIKEKTLSSSETKNFTLLSAVFFKGLIDGGVEYEIYEGSPEVIDEKLSSGLERV